MSNKSIFHAITTVGAATLLTKLVSLAAIGYPARILGPENYGIYAYGMSLSAYAAILLIPGLTVWGTRHIAQNKELVGETIGSINFVRLTLAIVAYLGLYTFSDAYASSLNEKNIILICGLTIFTNALSVDWAFNGLERTSIPAWLSLINNIIVVSCLFILIHTPGDLFNYALIMPVVSLSIVFLSYITLRIHGVIIKSPQFTLAYKAVHQSKQLIAVFALITIGHYASNIIIKKELGAESLGIFMAAYYLFELASSIPSLVGTVVMPRISRYVITDRPRALSVTAALSRGYMLLGFLMVSILYSEADFIFDLIYGNKYNESINVFRMMCIGLVFNFAVCGYTNILMSFSEDNTMLLVTITSNILAVLLSIILIPTFGIVGASAIIAIIDGAGWLVSLKKYKNIIGEVDILSWLRPSAGALLVILLSTTDLISSFHILFKIFIYCFTYVAITWSKIKCVFYELKNSNIHE